jgi:uncharacterized protein YndB with AHSA1/START domain
MELNFRISGRIAKPVEEVFEAVVDPARLSEFFTTGGAKGRLEQGAIVFWTFAEQPGEFPVKVIELVPNEKIVFEWNAYEGKDGKIGTEMVTMDHMTTVTMLFAATDDGRTLVQIIEEGWSQTPGGLRGSYTNCEGWTIMLLSMKSWLEHRIDIGKDLYS